MFLVAEMIQEALDKVSILKTLFILSRASVLLFYPEHGSEEGDLLQNADRNVCCKAANGFCHLVFDPRLNNTAEKC